MSVGIMRHAFEAALKFCKEDSRGGKVKILERQSVSNLLMDVKMKVEAGRVLNWKATSVLESANDALTWPQKLEMALESKIWCSDAAPKAVLEAMAAVGGKSYAKDMPFSRLLEDAACLPLFDGGNVGVRRRQLEQIFQRDDYDSWAATFL
jgi:alkylation response protein AidB-like acyl-CoA dehydrogenase